ncbi:hypothetical protein GGR54DRAFT_421760 [Hypoxylon sp. NC1633]|nr:hypothetical protein GGR54DRAFT_421760 [Hypoxylon sp. NC1633]
MAPVTEFVNATRMPGADLTPVYNIFSSMSSVKGSHAIRASQLVEDAEKFTLFVDWDAVDDHLAFQTTDAYKAFMGKVMPHSNGRATVFHAEVTPFPPTVLDNAEGRGKTPVAEVVYTYFEPEADAAKGTAAGQALVAGLSAAGFGGLTGESSIGWTVEKDVDFKGEKTRVLVIIIGWESVEAHSKARSTDAYNKVIADFQSATEGVKGVQISHVSTKTL